MRISGEFAVQLQPLPTHIEAEGDYTLGRMGIVKTFYGALDARSRGEMLSALTPTPGSAGYVALEYVEGTLAGKRGAFLLQHFGTMQSGNNRLILEVVPDSGSHELQGLSGQMQIRVEAGQHFYDFDYHL